MIGDLPRKVLIGNTEYEINTDYRIALLIFEAIDDPDLNDSEKSEVMLRCLYCDPEKIPDDKYVEALEAAAYFLDAGRTSTRNNASAAKLISWTQDEQLMFSALNKVAGMEIRDTTYLHWWTFLGYFSELGEGLFSTVLHIRQKRAARKQLSAAEKEFVKSHKEIIDIVPKRSAAELAERARLNELLNGGEGVSQTVI